MSNVTHRSNSRRADLMLIAVTCLALAGTAQAAPAAADITNVKVTYSDLNLAAEQGNQTLYARIRAAARQACFAYQVDNRDLRAVANERECENSAIEQALLNVCEQKSSDRRVLIVAAKGRSASRCHDRW